VNAEKAEGRRLVIDWVFSDLDRRYVLTLEHCALTYLADRRSERPDATVTLARPTLDRLVLRDLTFTDAVQQRLVAIVGDATAPPRSSTSSTTSR
jgi:alkyl sulfatase BDS1-like metallo-beta-lactamase superfamily hydrolase